MVRCRAVALASAAAALDIGLRGGPAALASAAAAAAATAAPPPVWHDAVDFTYLPALRGFNDGNSEASSYSSAPPLPSSHAALCDVGALESLSCTQDIWKPLLKGLCKHCRDSGQCTSDHELAMLVDEALTLYMSLAKHHGNAVVNDFGCRHGILAAIVFESEHLGFEWRRPVVAVELLRTAEAIEYRVEAGDRDRIDEIIEQGFRDGNIPDLLMDPSALRLTDVDGFEVQMRGGVPPVERFPLHFVYRQPADRREFLHLHRLYMLLNSAKDGYDAAVMNLNLPLVNLAPFPLNTVKLRAMRRVGQGEYDQFVADVSAALAGRGIFHVVMPGDATTDYLTAIYETEQSKFLRDRYGLGGRAGRSASLAPLRGAAREEGAEEDAGVRRSSIFVPLEQRRTLVQLLWGPGDGPAGLGSHRKAVELSLGHLQVGEPAYHFASGLNFRVFCDACLWMSIYFYVTESIGATASVLPIDFWLPCRIPASDLFPVRQDLLGDAPQVRVPQPRVVHSGSASVQGLGLLLVAQAPQGVLRGSCRESLARGLAGLTGGGTSVVESSAEPGSPALPPALPELLPMHDIGDHILPNASLELLMALKQFHAASGLELYQDKIALSLEFQRRGLEVPRLYYSSYDGNFDVRPMLRRLEAASEPYVAKASHMCCSQGVVVMEDGVDRVSGKPRSVDEIQAMLQDAFRNPFKNITAVCGDWGTVEAGNKPGVIVEELVQPSIPLGSLLKRLGGGRWTGPDIVACHLVWSTILHCVWELKVRLPDGELHTENLGMIFRDGSCVSCTFPQPFGSSWPATVAMLEGLLPHTDYLRITVFVRRGRAVLNEIEYTSGGLEVVPLRIAREWTLRWLEGYHRYRS